MLALIALLQIAPVDSLGRKLVAGALGARLDAQLTRFADSGFSGTVLVVQNRRIVLLKGYGLADTTRRVRNTAATRFEMNSMTKMFTGVSILQLAAAGRLNVDDPVDRILGAFPPAKRGATVRQLAMHTSGLIVEGSNLAGESRDAFVGDVKQTPPESPPGAHYRYTNAGYSLLAAIIEVASGQRYEEYLRQHAFGPAGMKTAIFRDEVPENDDRFAHGYGGPPNPYVWGTRGAGGVWASVGDMYRWLVAVEDGVVLPAAQRTLLFSPPQAPSLEAFGWHVTAAAQGTRARIDKGGGSADFASQLLYYPDDRLVVIWACNDLRQRWRQTLNRVLPELVLSAASAKDPLPTPPELPGVLHDQ